MVASQDLEKLEIELEKAVYKKSYYEFFKMAFCQAEPGNQLSDNWHIEYLCEIGQREVERIARKEKRKKHLIINVCPRSAKSHIFTRMLNAWAWAYYPDTKFITVSFSGDLATEHSMDTKNLLMSVWYQRLYGDVFHLSRDQNEKTNFKNNKGGARKSRGTGGQILGSGADLIICIRGEEKIFTEYGYMQIKDLVENEINCRILSYNTNTCETEFKQVTRFEKNRNTKRLVKVTSSCGKSFVCTENHKVLTKNRGYIEARYLNENDTLLIK